ncbi:MAG: ABC transporter ATP-binding protein [Pseudomonadales bacterium]|nr:ABC transporter ATP-binding protein [Pseudomonadales bacterium]
MMALTNVSKFFPMGRGKQLHAVDDVSLSIGKEQVVGLVGESGSGKSTLGRMIVGLHSRDQGDISYDGELLPTRFRAQDHLRYARRLQMIFQDPYASLNPRMTIYDILSESLRLQGRTDAAAVTGAVTEWLKTVGLHPDHMTRYPHEFSGGQRQRIGIARALMIQPDFVVCDEPISALDVSVQAQIINLLSELKASMGLTLLFIAHDLSMVRYISDRMAVMYLGKIVEEGPANEVFFNPQHPYTQLLIASNPEPDPAAERSRIVVPIRGEVSSPVNPGPGCRFADRCPNVTTQCALPPPEVIVSEGHRASCHLLN